MDSLQTSISDSASNRVPIKVFQPVEELDGSWRLTYKKILFWLLQMSPLHSFIVLAGDQLILIFPASPGLEASRRRVPSNAN